MEGYCIVLISLLLSGSICLQSSSAMTVTEIATNLRLYVTLEQNYYPKDQRFLFRFDLVNVHPSQSIESGDWAIFFTATRMLEIDDLIKPGPLPNPEGVPLGDSGFQLYHINGRLFKIQLLQSANKPLTPGEMRSIHIHGNLWIIARTDFTMNAYVASLTNDYDVATIPNTADLKRRFVSPFTQERQYKRLEKDTFSPYTFAERDKNYEVTDLGHDNNRVIPNPLMQELNDTITTHIMRESWVVYDNKLLELRFETQYLHEKTEVPLTAVMPSSNYVQLNLDDSLTIESCNGTHEAYRLEIHPDYVQIVATNSTGVFYGIQTFLQLLDVDGSIPIGIVEDCPLFPYRGVMIDPARQFVSKETVLRLIDGISRYKMNKLHFHLSDDDGWRIEIPHLPELTNIGAFRCHDLKNERCILPTHGSPPTPDGAGSGFYTVEDYREILQFAANRHVQVIPEIDMPGHSHAAVNAMLARYRKFNGTDIDKAREFLLSDFEDNTEYLTVQLFSDSAINPCIESTYEFVKVVLNALLEMHHGIQDLQVFHFGGDEVPGAWEKSPRCEELKLNDPDVPLNATTRDLIAYFAKRVGNITAAFGVDLAGWEDGLQNADREELTIPFPRTIFPNENVYAYQWFNTWEDLVGGGSYRFANADYKSIIAHATHFYFDFPSEPDPEERGGYWASRATDTKRSFFYAIDDVYENIDRDRWGAPLTREQICDQDRGIEICPELNPDKAENVVGIQCQAWAESITTSEDLENMLFPRILAVAERAWAMPEWYNVTDEEGRQELLNEDWTGFANAIGYRELQRLESMGIRYHIRPPSTRQNNSTQSMSPLGEFPGTPVLLTTDNGMTWTSAYPGMQMPQSDSNLIARSRDGTRSSRSVELKWISGGHLTRPTLLSLIITFAVSVKMIS